VVKVDQQAHSPVHVAHRGLRPLLSSWLPKSAGSPSAGYSRRKVGSLGPGLVDRLANGGARCFASASGSGHSP
jgi:hypothetical protein